jgi:hypothetical protein
MSCRQSLRSGVEGQSSTAESRHTASRTVRQAGEACLEGKELGPGEEVCQKHGIDTHTRLPWSLRGRLAPIAAVRAEP